MRILSTIPGTLVTGASLFFLWLGTIGAEPAGFRGDDGVEEREAPGQVLRLDSGPFRIITTDRAASALVGDVFERLERNLGRFFTRPIEFRRKIQLQLVPPGRGNLEGDLYRISFHESGSYALSIRWDESLPFEILCEALALVTLKQLAFERHDRTAAELVPMWLASAHGLMLQVSLRPSLRSYLHERSKAARVYPPREIFETENIEPDDVFFRLNALWMHEWIILSLNRHRGDPRSFFDAVLSGENEEAVFRRQLPEIFADGEALERRWVIGFQELIHRAHSPVESREESLDFLARMLEFDLVVDGIEMVVELDGLWEFRGTEEVRQLARFHRQMVEARFSRINPVFRNAATGILTALDHFENDRRRPFERAVETLIEDWQSAIQISRAITRTIEGLGVFRTLPTDS